MKYTLKVSLIRMAALLCVAITLVYAQIPDTAWTRTYFTGDDWDWAYDVQQTTDGGYVIAGFTYPPGSPFSTFVYLIKTDSEGDTLWTKVYGGSANWQDDIAYAVQQTPDKGYIVVGMTMSFSVGGEDAWILKTDSLGDTLWTKAYGGAEDEQLYSVQQTPDGGYIIAGGTSSFGAGPPGTYDVWLLKTNSLGDTLWTRTYGDTLDDGHGLVQLKADGGYIVGAHGQSYSGGNLDIWFMRTDSSGDSLWFKTYGGPDHDVIDDFRQTSDGGYIIVGTIGIPSSPDIWLIRTDSLGNVQWDTTYGGAGEEFGRGVDTTAYGDFVVTGWTWSFGAGGEDVWVIRTYDDGRVHWDRTYGGPQNDWSECIRITSDSGYVIAGNTESFATAWMDVWLLKMETDIGIEEHQSAQPVSGILQISPNPFRYKTDIRYQIREGVDSRQKTVVSMKIYNAAGRLVKNFSSLSSVIGHPSSVTWDGRDDQNRMLSSGVYFLKLQAGDYSATEKLLLIR